MLPHVEFASTAVGEITRRLRICDVGTGMSASRKNFRFLTLACKTHPVWLQRTPPAPSHTALPITHLQAQFLQRAVLFSAHGPSYILFHLPEMVPLLFSTLSFIRPHSAQMFLPQSSLLVWVPCVRRPWHPVYPCLSHHPPPAIVHTHPVFPRLYTP